jgi:hypothetical protein
MTLSQQFPDFSVITTNERTLRKQLFRSTNEKSKAVANKLDADTKYYENEFRKWHYKLLLIISLILTGLYTFLYNLPRLIQLIQF